MPLARRSANRDIWSVRLESLACSRLFAPTNQEATAAVINPTRLTPEIITKTAMIRPVEVTGYLSLEPAVVSVQNAHQSVSPKVLMFEPLALRSTPYIATQAGAVIKTAAKKTNEISRLSKVPLACFKK